MGTLFFSAIGFGIAFCAPPGIVTAEAIRRGTARGYWPAFLVELGSLVGDAVWATIALIGASFVVENTVVRLSLGLTGTGLLTYLAWGAFRDARAGTASHEEGAVSQGDFATGTFLSLGNPFAVVFWLGVGGSVVSTLIPHPQTTHLIVFLSGFVSGGLLWSVILAGIVAWGRRLLRPVFFRWVNLCCGAFLAVFGVQLFWSTLHSLFASQ